MRWHMLSVRTSTWRTAGPTRSCCRTSLRTTRGAHQVPAVAVPAGVSGAQEIRHDRGLAGSGRSHDRGKGEEPDHGDGTVARPVGLPRSIADLGISKEEFERAMPDLTKLAFDDPSWRSNPRMPLMSEFDELFWKAYEGRGLAKLASTFSNKPRSGWWCVWQRSPCG